MSLSNSRSGYGGVSKLFHWLIALLIFTVIPLGIVASGLAHQIADPTIDATDSDVARAAFLFSLHKTIGVTIFFVALARIAWAISQPKPGSLHPDRRLETGLAETVHWLLYGSLVLVPLAGWIHHAATTGFAPIWWPFGQSLPFVPKDEQVAALFGGLHIVLERVLVVALLLHIAGALKHQFVDRDATLRRMLPGRTDVSVPDGQRHPVWPVGAAVACWAAAIAVGANLGAYQSHAAQAPADKLAEVRSDWTVTDGTLDISVTQLGNTVTGAFADWTAAITFEEPDAPGPAGEVEVTVAIASLSLGSVTAQAMGPDFFGATEFPTATFVGQIEKTDAGYVASGPLTIKGTTVPIVLPFSLEQDGDIARMQGEIGLQRLDFGVGSSLPDESSLGFGVDVKITLSASRSS